MFSVTLDFFSPLVETCSPIPLGNAVLFLFFLMWMNGVPMLSFQARELVKQRSCADE